ncbi:hypothetical protein EKE94_14555 [Mesobaculum littorinae]|uniref:Uncharacterized protein n=1 Tax=Mesobaculum littorinae TaxID=2486419 RepID=A0A438AF52_9RHOB|nr:hypothetical protein EKE94_14555 [Mesobaculum littorinae]
MILAASIAGLLIGCGRVAESRLNPFTWFGGSSTASAVPASTAAPEADPRPVMDQISSLTIDRTPGGAILRATGVPPTQGYWEGALIPVETAEPGVLSYTFRAAPPPEPTRVSTQASREVVVGLFLSNQTLAGVSEINVAAARNGLAVRR